MPDERLQRAVLEAGHERGMRDGQLGRRDVEQQHAVDGRFTPHGAARVDLDAAAAADDHDASELREQREVVVEIQVRGHLEDDVHAGAGRGLADGVEVAGCRVVDDHVRAVCLHEGAAAFGAGGADDEHAVRACQLDGGDADTTAGAVHQYGLAGPRVGAPEERVVGRGVRHAHGGALRVADVRRQVVQLCRRTEYEFRAQAGVRRAEVVVGDVDAVARCHGRHVRANSDDVARAVVPWRVGKGRLCGVDAAADVGVDRVDANGPDTYQDLRRRRRRIGQLLDLHHLGGTELADDNRAHGHDAIMRNSWHLYDSTRPWA